MKLLGRDISGAKLLARLEARLKERGLAPASNEGGIAFGELEPPVNPLAFYLEAMAEHADAARPLPLETHRGGAGRAVLAAKWLFRKSGQVFINEVLGRQRLFNGHVRDSYAQLSADVVRLTAELEALKAKKAKAVRPSPRPRRRRSARRTK